MSFERDGPQGLKLLAYNRWLEDRPEHVRSVAAKFPPWRRYRLCGLNVVVGLVNISEVTEGGEGYKPGDVLFNVKVIEVPRNRPGVLHHLGKIVTGVRPELLQMLEPE